MCTALFAMFAFMVSSVEVLLPELHDGDAAPVPTWSAATIDHASSVVALDNGQAVLTSDSALPDAHHAAHPGAHIDHCGHSHAATQARGFMIPIERGSDCVADAAIVKLVSFELPPLVRPPIL